MKSEQKGFTLIELVSVIVILGIIAAIAVPRFINLTTQARIAALNGMAGALRSGATLAHSQALALGLACPASGGSTITMEGQTITLNACYPSGDTTVTTGTGGISVVMGNSAGFLITSTGTVAGGVTTFTLADANNNPITNCLVTYTAPSTATGATSVPVVAMTSTGC